jgi:hypothetical protein
MTAATFHTSSVAETSSHRRPGFFVRFIEGMMEARLHAAMRELNRHRHLIPEDLLKKSGYKASLNDDSAFPFTR